MGEPSNDTQRTLWIGDLGYWMDENFLYNLFAGTGTVTSVKIIRSKATNVSEGYGFIEFNSHEAASQVREHAGACLLNCSIRPFARSACHLPLDIGALDCTDFDNLQRLPHPGDRPDLQAELGRFWSGQGQLRRCARLHGLGATWPLGMFAPLPSHMGFSGSQAAVARFPAAADHSVFVGDLAPDVTDYVLQEHFRQYFPSVRSAKV